MQILLKKQTQVEKAYHVLRHRIMDMAVGLPLPPMSFIMRELSISQTTLDRAYSLLESEGIIHRRPGKGVFVASRYASGEMAIVIQPTFFDAKLTPYYRTACTALTHALKACSSDWQVKLHVGQATETDQLFPRTLDLLEPETLPRLRGVFSFHPLFELEPMLAQADVPLIRLAGCVVADQKGYNAGHDYYNFFQQSLQHLADQGCRSVGLISTIPKIWVELENFNFRVIDVKPLVTTLARKVGLECLPIFKDQACSEQSGYDLFQRFWASENRPDGIIVTDDIVCNGVLRAALVLGVTLPDDLKLITMTNKGIPLAYHEPITSIEFDADEMATQAVAMMDDLLQHRSLPDSTCLLKGRLIQGKST